MFDSHGEKRRRARLDVSVELEVLILKVIECPLTMVMLRCDEFSPPSFPYNKNEVFSSGSAIAKKCKSPLLLGGGKHAKSNPVSKWLITMIRRSLK